MLLGVKNVKTFHYCLCSSYRAQFCSYLFFDIWCMNWWVLNSCLICIVTIKFSCVFCFLPEQQMQENSHQKDLEKSTGLKEDQDMVDQYSVKWIPSFISHIFLSLPIW